MSVLKLFNNQLIEFLSDVSTVFPRDSNIKTARFFVENMIKVNPSLLIKLWYRDITTPYKTQIESGNIEFFLEKDYNSDIIGKENPESIMQVITIIKKMISELNDDERKKVISYVQNFTKISCIYNK
jgi:hypothetical protein